MSSILEYNIQSFSSNSDINLLNEIYLLNQSNTPEVGSLDSVGHLQNLLQMSLLNLFVSKNEEMLGFITILPKIINFFLKERKSFFILIELQLLRNIEEKDLVRFYITS